MTIVYLPRVGDDTVKDKIIEFLLKDVMTHKEICSKVSKECKVTYQGVYKALGELIEKEIIVKKSNTYEINKEWIKRLKGFVEDYELNQKDLNIQLEEGMIKKFDFKNSIEFGKFCFKFLNQKSSNNKTDLFFNKKNIYNLTWMSTVEHFIFKKIINKFSVYILCDKDNEVERWYSKGWLKIGSKIVYGFDYCSTCDFIVLDDIVIQIFFDNRYEEVYESQATSIKDYDINVFSNAIATLPVKVHIFKDADLAADIKKRTMKHF